MMLTCNFTLDPRDQDDTLLKQSVIKQILMPTHRKQMAARHFAVTTCEAHPRTMTLLPS
jgi:hypothetical protein